jgi:hypothetical protein
MAASRFPPATSLIMSAPAATASFATSERYVSAESMLWYEATNFFFYRYTLSSWPCGNSPDINDINTFFKHLLNPDKYSILAAVAATVEKRIRSDIQNAHDPRTVKIYFAMATMQDRFYFRLIHSGKCRHGSAQV